ncbi:MAG TPA: LON peptidase substrate-binding domain-containing protein, partial [Rhodothermales bacterium]|nr:LON peptidase substrate-binding domain-containing protein [Rhodothermales bacterium]
GLVLYPDEPVPLHIFEPRYRELVRRCMEDDLAFGVVYADGDDMAEVGCTARIRRIVTRYDDGRLDIVAVGEARFRVRELFHDLAYLTADVEPFGVEALNERPDPVARERMITQHMKLLEFGGEAIRPQLYQSARFVSFAVAPSAGLEPAEKQQLLEMATERERVDFLVAHFERALVRLEKARRLRSLARGDGHSGLPPELGG